MHTRRSGRTSPLLHDPEIEKTARSNRKATKYPSTVVGISTFEFSETHSDSEDSETSLQASSTPSLDAKDMSDDEDQPLPPRRGVDSYYRPGNFEDPSPIVYPAAANGVVSNFKIQPNLIAILPVFRGREDPYAHLREFFSIADTHQVNNTTKDGVRLRLFPFSLKDQAKAWFTSLEPGSINLWSKMQSAFLDDFIL
ncbi:reverse transcriptase domain-containing protein [Tanacetum coccineum]